MGLKSFKAEVRIISAPELHWQLGSSTALKHRIRLSVDMEPSYDRRSKVMSRIVGTGMGKVLVP